MKKSLVIHVKSDFDVTAFVSRACKDHELDPPILIKRENKISEYKLVGPEQKLAQAVCAHFLDDDAHDFTEASMIAATEKMMASAIEHAEASV
jgi:hypothetical protein